MSLTRRQTELQAFAYGRNCSTRRPTHSLPRTMTTALYLHTATLLTSGKVLVTGGFDASNNVALDTAEIFDPSTVSFTPTGSMGTVRYLHSASLLNNALRVARDQPSWNS
jgi:hypothetical protein